MQDIIKTILHQRASGIENTTENCLVSILFYKDVWW